VSFSKDVERVLKRDWSVKCFHYIDDSPFGPAYPIGEIHIIWDGGAEHDESNVFWKHNYSFFPYNTSFLVVDIVYLIKDYPFNVSDHIAAFVQIISQDLSSHDHAASLRIHTYVSSDNSYGVKQF
jgi:hypothetical protein